MLDRSAFWPATGTSSLKGQGCCLTLLPPQPQVMVSGDLAAFCARHDLPAPLGLLDPVNLAPVNLAPVNLDPVAGPRYTLRLARNRMLAVGVAMDGAQCGWADGIATTPMTGALAVMQITGPRAMDLFSRASAIDPAVNSPSAALMFAGVTAALCRDGAGLRLHVDRGLVSYLFDWAGATGLFG